MRAAINNNPIVQIGLLGVLGVIVAVLFLSNMGGGAPAEEAASPESASEAPAGTPVPIDEATPGAPVAPAPSAPEAVPGKPAGVTPFEAGKGLPAAVVNAYESGDVIVLLVMQSGGVEDESLKRDVESLETRGDTSVFVTDAEGVDKYSRIAEGVTLDRVPAIIVLHPLEGKASGSESSLPMPEASVAYGYRGKESVVQAVNDALYDGDSRAYSP
jgi:hypothetical protein